jgi:hypothetical protein
MGRRAAERGPHRFFARQAECLAPTRTTLYYPSPLFAFWHPLKFFIFWVRESAVLGFKSTFACNQGYQALWSWRELYCWWNRSDPSNTHEVRAMKSMEKLWNWVLDCCQPVTPSNWWQSLQPWPPHLIHLYNPNKLFTLTKFCTQAGALLGCQLVIFPTQTRA